MKWVDRLSFERPWEDASVTDDELVEALRTLRPTSELPGTALFKADALRAAGIDPDHLQRWARSHGGGALEAGRLKVRRGQRLEEALPGRPQTFYAVPLTLLE